MNNYKITFILFTFIVLLGLSNTVLGDEIVHKFKNPSFSGIGTGAHYLTIENQEHSRKKAIEDSLEAARNLAARIYAQCAKQLVESMFSNDNPAGFGSFILEGNTITWEVITDESGAEFIRLTIIAEDGSETVVEIPVGTGNFGQDPDTGGGDGGG